MHSVSNVSISMHTKSKSPRLIRPLCHQSFLVLPLPGLPDPGNDSLPPFSRLVTLKTFHNFLSSQPAPFPNTVNNPFTPFHNFNPTLPRRHSCEQHYPNRAHRDRTSHHDAQSTYTSCNCAHARLISFAFQFCNVVSYVTENHREYPPSQYYGLHRFSCP